MAYPLHHCSFADASQEFAPKNLSGPDDFGSIASYSIQSLEEILNEPDPQAFDDSFLAEITDELNKQQQDYFDNISEINSIATSSSFSRDLSHASDWKRPQRKKQKSQILRCVKLKRLSTQLTSADEKIKSGVPTSIAAGCSHIAVGTAHGLVIIFDAKQVMLNCLGNSKNAYDQGSVSSLCFNRDDSKLVSGYAKGALLLHDTKSGRLLARCDVIQAVGNGILSCQFLSPAANSLCLVNDAGGSVYAVNFGRSIEKSCRCLFTGSKGDVCRVTPLTGGPLDYFRLVALTSLTKLIVLRLKPWSRVQFTIPQQIREAHADSTRVALSPPLVAWCPQPHNGEDSLPSQQALLAYGRLNCVHIFRLSLDRAIKDDINSTQIAFIDVTEQNADVLLISLSWINSKCLLLLDQSEKVRLFDALNRQCLECVDLSDVQLVYSTPIFKGLATGGNVSRALAFMAENSCYNSTASYGYGCGSGQVLLLGHKSVFVLSLNSWIDCVNVLTTSDPPDYPGAICLCLDFFTGKRNADFYGSGSAKIPQPSVTNHSNSISDWERRKLAIIQEKALALLLEYVDISLSKFAPNCGKVDVLLDYYRNVVPFCLETCVALNRQEIIYSLLYDRFSLDSLAKNVFFDCLDEYVVDDKLSDLPPALVQQFIAHLEREGFYSAIENCVVHLPIFSLDVHQVMTVCRNYNLYDAIIYVFNCGLLDYISPVQEMLEALQNIDDGECLSDEDIRLGNKLLLYITCCLSGKSYFGGDLPADRALEVINETYDFLTKEYSEKAGYKAGDLPFQNVRALLKFDCREFLNGLGIAFEGDFFRTRNGSVKARYFVDILLKVILKSHDWSPFQTGALFTFIVRQVVMHSGELLINGDQFNQILELVICGDIELVGTSIFEEKQQALLDLLQKPQSRDLVDEHQLISLAEKHHYYQVCEVIYSRRREFDKVVVCYANDPYRKDAAFAYVRNVLSNANILLSEKLAVKSKFLRIIKVVAQSDIKECAQLIVDHFTTSLLTISTELGEQSDLLFRIMKEIYEIRMPQNENIRKFCDDEYDDAELTKIFVNLFCLFAPASDLIQLLKSDRRFNTKNTLEICQKQKATGAVIVLLIQQHDIDGAFGILQKEFEAVVQKFGGKPMAEYLLIIQTGLVEIHRSNAVSSVEFHWLKLLDVVLHAADKISERNSIDPDFKLIISELITNTMNVVDPSIVLKNMLGHSTFKAMNYGEIGPMITMILRGYDYEQVLFNALIGCMKNEAQKLVAKLVKISSKGSVVCTAICGICGQVLHSGVSHEKSDRFAAFRCKHFFHCSCLQTESSYKLGKHGTIDFLCFLCNNSHHGRKSTKFSAAIFAPCNSHSVEKIGIDSKENGCSKNFVINSPYGTQSKMRLLEELRKTSVCRYENGKLVRDAFQADVRPDDFKLRLAPPHF